MIDVQGHRFARGLFPENTLEGLDAACRLGLSSFETDIAITADGVPVIHHDPALNPDTTRGLDGNWLEKTGPLINHLTFADLASLDVGRLNPGSTYAGRYASQRPHDGARIPTLEALLAYRSAIRLNIELKLFPAHPDWTVSPEEMVDRVLHAVDAARRSRSRYAPILRLARAPLRASHPPRHPAWLADGGRHRPLGRYSGRDRR